MTLYLINSRTGAVAAELTPGKKVDVFEKWMQKSLKSDGVIVTEKFQKEFKTTLSVVTREDGESLFANAFKECYYASGLQQQGYDWSTKHPSKWSSEEELAKELIEIYKKSVEK